jgi:NAD(P)-dependent dehydrogenase (short-subunit alcohol dehydrogenase family)
MKVQPLFLPTLRKITRSLALEIRSYGIRVNAIAPGLTGNERVMKLYTRENWVIQADSITNEASRGAF